MYTTQLDWQMLTASVMVYGSGSVCFFSEHVVCMDSGSCGLVELSLLTLQWHHQVHWVLEDRWDDTVFQRYFNFQSHARHCGLAQCCGGPHWCVEDHFGLQGQGKCNSSAGSCSTSRSFPKGLGGKGAFKNDSLSFASSWTRYMTFDSQTDMKYHLI